MNETEPWVILLWGAPAAGKSTLARKLATEYQSRTGSVLAHLGTDKLNHSMLGEHFEGGIRPKLYDCLVSLARELLNIGRPVLIEGTFLDPERRSQVERLAAEADVRLISVQIECRLALRESRNEDRAAGSYVPEEFLKKAHELAKNQIRQADLVFDTELNECDGLAQFLLGAVGVGPNRRQGLFYERHVVGD